MNNVSSKRRVNRLIQVATHQIKSALDFSARKLRQFGDNISQLGETRRRQRRSRKNLASSRRRARQAQASRPVRNISIQRTHRGVKLSTHRGKKAA